MLLADGKAVIHVLKKLKPKVGNETPAWLTPRMQEVAWPLFVMHSAAGSFISALLVEHMLTSRKPGF